MRKRKFLSFGIPIHALREFEEPSRQTLKKGKDAQAAAAIHGATHPARGDVPQPPTSEETFDIGVSPEPGHRFEFRHEELVTPDELKQCKVERRGAPSTETGLVSLNAGRKKKPKAPLDKKRSDRETYSKSTISKLETQDRAIQIVMLYEREQGREPRDLRDTGVGYDVESSDRKIEVKSFKDTVGILEFYESEYEAADRHRENFYIYVVSGLLKGATPTIQIIRDPFKCVTFVAEKRVAKNWKDSVEETVTFTV